MKEIPILFSIPMVKALLAGTKTQTRRIVKPQPIVDEDSGYTFFLDRKRKHKNAFDIHSWKDDCLEQVSKWQPGDILWVRENIVSGALGNTYWATGEKFLGGHPTLPEDEWIHIDDITNGNRGHVPSIHMKRSWCRIFLEVESVRVERLQDISEADAIAEGIEKLPNENGLFGYRSYATTPDKQLMPCFPYASYRTLWESINGSGSWELNPWVFVIRFKRIENPTT